MVDNAAPIWLVCVMNSALCVLASCVASRHVSGGGLTCSRRAALSLLSTEDTINRRTVPVRHYQRPKDQSNATEFCAVCVTHRALRMMYNDIA